MKLQHTLVRRACFRIFLLLPLVLSGVLGCSPPPPPPPGTDAEALLGRTTMQDGQATLQDLGAELATVLNGFGLLHPAADLIIDEPSGYELPVIGKSLLSPHFGIHIETTPGNFQLTSGGSDIIVQLLNGIDMNIDSFIYDTADNVTAYRLRIVSNMRSIATPLAEQADVKLSYTQYNLNLSIGNFIVSSYLDTTGWIHFTRNATTPVKYDVKRVLGAGSAGITTVNTQNYTRIRDYTNGTTDAPFWNTSEVIQYQQAPNTSIWVGYSAAQSYQDNTITNSIDLISDTLANVSVSGLVSYSGRGNVDMKTTTGKVRIGQIEGGPYVCDVTQPTLAGTGTDITIAYNNGASEAVFPSTRFTCAQVVAQ